MFDFAAIHNEIEKMLGNCLGEGDATHLQICYEWDGETDVNRYGDILDLLNPTFVDAGCTKLVFALHEFPELVFKVPFFGTSLWNEDEERYGSIQYYNQADNVPVDDIFGEDDYCAVEARVFELAQEHNVDEFFAGTFFLGVICGVPLYVSEKIMRDHRTFEVSEDSHNTAKELIGEGYSPYNLDEYQLSAVVEMYGPKKANALNTFLNTYQIDDLHSGNVRWTHEGQFKIIDYSGYREDVWY